MMKYKITLEVRVPDGTSFLCHEDYETIIAKLKE